MLQRYIVRSFSTAIQTSFHPGSAQVLINLPTKGNVWFFLTQEDTVEKFASSCRVEDSEVENVIISKGRQQLDTESNMYDHICQTITDGQSLNIAINGRDFTIEPPILSEAEKVHATTIEQKASKEMQGIPAYQASIL